MWNFGVSCTKVLEFLLKKGLLCIASNGGDIVGQMSEEG